MSFRIHEEDKEPLERDPAAVHGHEFPAYGVESNRIDVVGEEEANLAKDLLNSNTSSSHMIREKLNEESWNLLSMGKQAAGNATYCRSEHCFQGCTGQYTQSTRTAPR
jgi:hypothetical protein